MAANGVPQSLALHDEMRQGRSHMGLIAADLEVARLLTATHSMSEALSTAHAAPLPHHPPLLMLPAETGFKLSAAAPAPPLLLPAALSQSSASLEPDLLAPPFDFQPYPFPLVAGAAGGSAGDSDGGGSTWGARWTGLPLPDDYESGAVHAASSGIGGGGGGGGAPPSSRTFPLLPQSPIALRQVWSTPFEDPTTPAVGADAADTSRLASFRGAETTRSAASVHAAAPTSAPAPAATGVDKRAKPNVVHSLSSLFGATIPALPPSRAAAISARSMRSPFAWKAHIPAAVVDTSAPHSAASDEAVGISSPHGSVRSIGSLGVSQLTLLGKRRGEADAVSTTPAKLARRDADNGLVTQRSPRVAAAALPRSPIAAPPSPTVGTHHTSTHWYTSPLLSVAPPMHDVSPGVIPYLVAADWEGEMEGGGGGGMADLVSVSPTGSLTDTWEAGYTAAGGAMTLGSAPRGLVGVGAVNGHDMMVTAPVDWAGGGNGVVGIGDTSREGEGRETAGLGGGGGMVSSSHAHAHGGIHDAGFSVGENGFGM